jgi:hypothetical protein
MSDKERYEVLRRLHAVGGNLSYALEVFGDALAKREGYRDPELQGMEAVYFFLIQKFHWLPKDVRAMSAAEIRFVLKEEMHGWVMPKAAR